VLRQQAWHHPSVLFLGVLCDPGWLINLKYTIMFAAA
jgi:hypothetical protein